MAASRVGQRTRSVPRFDPPSALGWDDVALDGLSCFLRCVEALLVADGCSVAQVAQAMAMPLDLVRRTPDARPYGDFLGCRVKWSEAPPGGDLWDEVLRRLRADQPTILLPDRYWWPEDEFRGRFHFYDHMVLALDEQDGEVRVLDTDGPSDRGFLRSLRVSDGLGRACTKWGDVERLGDNPVLAPEAMAHRLLPGSLERLVGDVAELDAVLRAWRSSWMPYRLARGLHVVVLGDIQPQLFLWARALDGAIGPHADTRLAALNASRHAKRLGRLLIALHGYENEHRYGACRPALVALVDGLRRLAREVAVLEGMPPPVFPPSDGARFLRRLDAVTAWCFDAPDSLSDGWLAR